MGATGESVRRLTEGGYNPAWSPDGERSRTAPRCLQAVLAVRAWHARSGVGREARIGEKRRLTADDRDAVQPSWSPHGQRIAFWGLRPGGQRDLWTVASSGDAASLVGVTNDPDLDWNPVWSPDGGFLYLLERPRRHRRPVAHPDRRGSGKPLGPPEACRPRFPFVAYMSFTRDGPPAAAVGAFETDAIVRGRLRSGAAATARASRARSSRARSASSTPRRPPTAAPSRSLRGASARTSTRSSVGRRLRQLTNDAFKDRGPSLPFPTASACCSTPRAPGSTRSWSMRLDGSGATQLTRTANDEVVNPDLSRDGSKLLRSLSRSTGSAWLRSTARCRLRPRLSRSCRRKRLSPIPSGRATGPASPGCCSRPSGRRTLGVYSLESKSYRAIDRGR
jgi:hypothetical protein